MSGLGEAVLVGASDRNLCVEPLLQLQSLGKYVNNSCKFGKTDHFAAWNVGNMHLAEKRHKMMLASG